MTLNLLKARTGIAALTFAAADVPFVLASPAKAITIAIDDTVQTEPKVRVTITANGLSRVF
jgi:hypothetical protein